MGVHNIEKLDYPNSIESILNYASIEEDKRKKYNLPRNIEKAFGRTCGKRALDWGEYQDVIYSFLSLYAIGLRAYNPNDIEIRTLKKGYRLIRVDLMLGDDIIWNSTLLKGLNDTHSPLVQNLNENKELQKFTTRYISIGNIMPTWPNGNKAKGLQENLCFDIPELYYGGKNQEWFNIMAQQFSNAYLDELLIDVNADYTKGLKTFLESLGDPESYTAYLKHVNNVIEHRTIAIEKWLDQNKPKFKGLHTRFSQWSQDADGSTQS